MSTTVPDLAAVEVAAKRFCSLSTDYLQQLRLIEISLSSPDRLRELLESAAPAIAESALLASQEVKADVTKLSGALDELRTAMEAANYELAKIPRDQVMKLQTPPVRDAVSRVEQFTAKSC